MQELNSRLIDNTLCTFIRSTIFREACRSEEDSQLKVNGSRDVLLKGFIAYAKFELTEIKKFRL